MITWLFWDRFPEDTEPDVIWSLFAFEILIEATVVSLIISFFRMFVL